MSIHDLVDQNLRTIHGRVEVIYTDLTIDTDVDITTTSEAYNSYSEQLTDGLETTHQKLFTLHNNVLDGSHKVCSQYVENGWRSRKISNALCHLIPSERITLTFNPRSIISLKIIGDDIANCFPVDFVVKTYDSTDTVITTTTVTGNTEVRWIHTFDQSYANICKIEVRIFKINKCFYPVRILEISAGIFEMYDDDDRLMAVNLVEEKEYDGGSIPLGNISSNEATIRLDDTDNHFSPDITTSILYGLLQPNRKVKIWLGIEDSEGNILWESMGRFYTTSWNISEERVYVEFTCRDKLHKLNTTIFETSTVYENYSLAQLARVVLTDAGLLWNEYEIDPALESIIIPVAWFERITYKEVLRLIAEAGLAVVYMDRDDKLIITQQSSTDDVIYVFDDDKNLYSKERLQQWNALKNYIEVYWRSYIKKENEVLLENLNLNEEIASGASAVLTFNFNQIPVSRVTSIILEGGSNLKTFDYTVYAWGMKITVINIGPQTEILTDINVRGDYYEEAISFTTTAQNLNSILQVGKLSYTLDNYLIQQKDIAITIAENLLTSYVNPLKDFILQTTGNMALKIGDKVTIPVLNSDPIECGVIRQEYEYSGSLQSNVTVRAVEEG